MAKIPSCISYIWLGLTSSSLLLWLSIFPLQAMAQCSMCSESTASLRNADTLIPSLWTPEADFPNCQQVADYASEFEVDTLECDLIQAQAAFCGCPEASPDPLLLCGVCPGTPSPDNVPANLDLETPPDGTTCGDLEEYLNFIMTTEECETDRIQNLKNTNWICECPNPTTACSMCVDGSRELANQDRIIPFLNIRGSDQTNLDTTCLDLQQLASLQSADTEGLNCDFVQKHSGYCGCANVQPSNVCSFCPDGSMPANLDLETPTGDTCQDLHDYFIYAFDDPADCDGDLAKSIGAMAFLCGCPGVEPSCELCQGSEVEDPQAFSGAEGLTCGDLQTAVWGASEGLCGDQAELIATGRQACCASDAISWMSLSLPLVALSMVILAVTFP